MKKRTLATIVTGTLLLTGCPQNAYAHPYSHVQKKILQVNGTLTAGDYDKNKDLNFEILTMNGKLNIQSLCNSNEEVLKTIRGTINSIVEKTHEKQYSRIRIFGNYAVKDEKIDYDTFEIQKGQEGGILIFYKDRTIHHFPLI